MEVALQACGEGRGRRLARFFGALVHGGHNWSNDERFTGMTDIGARQRTGPWVNIDCLGLM